MTAASTTGGTRLLIVGPPGAGKGTQAAAIAEHFSIPTISPGEIFRQNIRDETPLGLKVQSITSAGDLVPDKLTNEIVRDRLLKDDVSEGFLLDGYPRNLAQLDELDALLAENGAALDAVILLVADADEVVARLLKRSKDSGRQDDTEEVIRYRQEVYGQQTEPIIAAYSKRGIVATVDGLGSIDNVRQRIFAELANIGLVPSGV